MSNWLVDNVISTVKKYFRKPPSTFIPKKHLTRSVQPKEDNRDKVPTSPKAPLVRVHCQEAK